MRVVPVFEKVFSKIYGKPCWLVRDGYGSTLTFEFGKPHLQVREPRAARNVSPRIRAVLAKRRVFIHGDWHLWIYACDWKVFSRGKLVADSSTQSRAGRATSFIDGQKLTRFSISVKTLECSFHFDLGAILKTRPFDKVSEQWLLYDPSHKVLTLRADGLYQHGRSDLPPAREKWLPIQSKLLRRGQ